MQQEVDLRKGNVDAIFNPLATHRYFLRRRLSLLPTALTTACLFIMLNPSRADAKRSDNTVTRCMKFAQLWGFHQLWVCNLFALRTPYPADLNKDGDPIGRQNDEYITMAIQQADQIVVAYGNHGAYMDRGHHVIDMIRYEGKQAKAFGLTAQGHPIHPLARGKMWIPYDRELRNHEDLLIA